MATMMVTKATLVVVLVAVSDLNVSSSIQVLRELPNQIDMHPSGRAFGLDFNLRVGYVFQNVEKAERATGIIMSHKEQARFVDRILGDLV